jgi:hypothetical protein
MSFSDPFLLQKFRRVSARKASTSFKPDSSNSIAAVQPISVFLDWNLFARFFIILYFFITIILAITEGAAFCIAITVSLKGAAFLGAFPFLLSMVGLPFAMGVRIKSPFVFFCGIQFKHKAPAV